jgi:hypothetical protein
LNRQGAGKTRPKTASTSAATAAAAVFRPAAGGFLFAVIKINDIFLLFF